MKFNKMKLAALAMSALMAASTVSPAVYAADLFTDGSTEIFISEETEDVAEETPIMEITAPVEEIAAEESPVLNADDPGKPDEFVEGSVKFLYSDENPVLTVEYKVKVDGVVETRTTEATSEYRKADCENTEATVLKVTLYGKDYTKEIFISEKLGHVWVDTDDYYDIGKWPTHLKPGEAQIKQVCSRCGKEQGKPGSSMPLEKSDHVWGAPVYYAATTTNSNVKINEDKGVYSFPKDEEGVVEVISGNDVPEPLVNVYEVLLGSDGLPLVDKPEKKATYYAVSRCTSGDGYKIDLVTKYATESTFMVVKILDTDNIDTEVTSAASIKTLLETGAYNDKKVKLKDCTKPGRFEVLFYSDDVNSESSVVKNFEEDFEKGFLGKDVEIVDAHHWEKTLISFKSDKDQKRCTVKDNTVVNNSCLPVPYTKVTYCDNEITGGCNLDKTQSFKFCEPSSLSNTKLKVVNKVETSVEGDSTKHIYDTDVKNAIATLPVDTEKNKEYSKILNEVKKDSTYVSIPENLMTATCTSAGTITVVYRCKYCKKDDVYRETINVAKLGHDETGMVRENIHAATCTAAGSYDVTNTCRRCGKTLDKKSFTLAPLGHTNTEVTPSVASSKKLAVLFDGDVLVDNNTVGAKPHLLSYKPGEEVGRPKCSEDFALGTKNFDVKPMLCSICTRCGENARQIKDTDQTLIITLNKISKEGKSCQPGSVTLTATTYVDKIEYTKTQEFEYYSSKQAQSSRTAHNPGKVKREVIKEATETSDGLEKVTTYCSICGEAIEEIEEVIPALGVKPALPATPVVNAKAVDYNSIIVSWNAVEGADAYRLYYRSADLSITRWKLARVVKGTSTSFTHTGLTTGARYRYTVRAVVGDTMSDYSRTGAVARPLPAAPEMKSVTAVSNGTKITWSKVDGADGYIIFRKTTGAFTRVGAVSRGFKVTWTDKKPVSGATYKVRAYRTVNNVNYKGAFSAAM